MLRKSIVSSLVLLIVLVSKAQIMDVDKLYQEARNLALQKSYIEARNYAKKVLYVAPAYFDAGILIARTYAWQGNYDSARFEIEKILKIAPDYLDAILAAVDIEFWSGNYNKALEMANSGLNKFPANKDLLYKKAEILMALDRESEAHQILAYLLQLNPYNYQVELLLSKIKKKKNRIIFEHSINTYGQPNRYIWQCTSLQYQHEAKWGTWIGKINLGNLRIGSYDVTPSKNYQFEADAYPKMDSVSYLYLNYGYSPGDFFPTHRFGIEYFRTLKHSWELSFGGRYLNFFNGAIHHTEILTGSLSKYYSNNWFSVRPYLILNYSGISQSYFIFYRHYLNHVYNYLGGALGYGIAPDEMINRKANGFFSSPKNNFRLRFDFQHLITQQFLFRVMLGNGLEEYQQNNYRYSFDGNFYLAWLF